MWQYWRINKGQVNIHSPIWTFWSGNYGYYMECPEAEHNLKMLGDNMAECTKHDYVMNFSQSANIFTRFI